MRKFTKSILALALIMVGAMNANAEKLYSDFSEISAGGGASWNAETKTMGWSGNWGNAVAYYMIKGIDNVGGYYDLSSWETITVTFSLTGNTNGVRIRMKDNTGGDGDWILMPEGTNTLKITDFKKGGAALNYSKIGGIQLSGGNNTTEESTAIFTELYLERPDDPLAIPKDNLTKAIALGNAQNSFAKTAASFAVLTDAITDGVAELANVSATAESLNTATQAIKDAIAGFVLLPGYTNLTKDMYFAWTSATAPTTGTSAASSCTYLLNSSTDMPYGHGSVPLLSFADLSTFDSFYVLATGGTPRILLNRDEDNGQWNADESASHLIDNTTGDAESWHAKYFSKDGSNITVDLKQLTKDKNFAHLHTIKKVGDNVAVSDMLLYRTITVGEEGYSTFGTLYKNAKPNGVKAYAAKVSGSKVTLTEVTNVPAGKGVVIEAAEGSYAPTFDVNADDIDTDLLVSNGTVVSDGTFYVLAKTDKNGVGFYKLANGEKVPAGKGYLVIDSNAPEFLGFGGDATGINEVKAVEAKGEFFNLAGQRVAKPAKGLYIANGKKVIIK